jgi:hypothetical protein
MNDLSPVRALLERYNCRTTDERRNALREIVQELSLLGLSRTNFFSRAVFYGGTALRIFHGLQRFSEDLDFSLAKSDPGFNLEDYLGAIQDELGAWGFEMRVERKLKSADGTVQSADGTVQSAFIKGGTLIHLVKIASISPPVSGVPENEFLKIKLEVDTDPPAGAGFEVKYRLNPLPFAVRLYDTPSLFAGKLHAVLCRGWQQRVKGRDFFDYLWYLSNDIPVNLAHLESRMRQSGHYKAGEALTRERLMALLAERFGSVDFTQAKADAVLFIKDSRAIELWSPEFFLSVSRERLQVKLD